MSLESTKRWVGLGRYYAMFQRGYAEEKVRKLTKKGDWVLDPFLGRGTTSFAAASLGRNALGCEINPVGWIFAKTKADPADEESLEARLAFIAKKARERKDTSTKAEFFHACYRPNVLAFLETARETLDWRQRKTDWTLASFIAMAMQTARTNGLSNQLQETKAMGPAYAIRWWEQRGLTPPEVDPEGILLAKIKRRYKLGPPPMTGHSIRLGDSVKILPEWAEPHGGRCSLLLTSPPYLGVCNYHSDQWLRLWLLGENGEHPDWKKEKNKDRFTDPQEYEDLLRKVFTRSKELMRAGGAVCVKTDTRKRTLEITKKVLKEIFGKIRETEDPFRAKTQTELYNGESSRGEIELNGRA